MAFDWETLVKWAIIGGVAVGGMFFLYKFAQSQGWITAQGGIVTRRRGARRMRFRGQRGGSPSPYGLFTSEEEWAEKPTIMGTLPGKGDNY